uniref:Uncharacterized protein n=1 Tax=Lactuca sativa TaxID=4236 RepID=A0A9R1WP36_LACSA|nr:hypothetical protein LSAT_V11C100046750 [Lactuca sativa]
MLSIRKKKEDFFSLSQYYLEDRYDLVKLIELIKKARPYAHLCFFFQGKDCALSAYELEGLSRLVTPGSDYLLGVVVAWFTAKVVLVTAVQLWMIELVSESGCEALNDMISRAESGRFVGAPWEEGYYMGGLRTGSHMMVIQRCQDSVV